MGERILLIIQRLIGTQRGSMTLFAARIGLKSGQVSDWVHGKAAPGAEYRRKICETFKISRDWLDTGEGEMTVSELPKTEEPKPEYQGTPAITEREIGRLEGEIKSLHAQIERYERRLERYDNEILFVLKKCAGEQAQDVERRVRKGAPF